MTTLRNIVVPVGLLALFGVAMLVGYSDHHPYRVVTVEPAALTIADEDETSQRTLALAPDARITLDGRVATLEEIAPGDRVAVKVRQDDLEQVATEVAAASTARRPHDGRAAPAASHSPAARLAPPLVAPEYDPLQAPFEDTQRSDDAASTGSDDSPAPKLVPAVFSGRILQVDDGTLTLSGPDGQSDVFLLTLNTQVTVEGEPGVLEDLRPDAMAMVHAAMSRHDLVATAVEIYAPAEMLAGNENAAPNAGGPVRLAAVPIAADPEDPFQVEDNEFEGTLANVGAGRIVLQTDKGETHIFQVTPEAVVTLDDKPVTLAALKPGQRALVVVQNDGEQIAVIRIAARSSAPE